MKSLKGENVLCRQYQRFSWTVTQRFFGVTHFLPPKQKPGKETGLDEAETLFFSWD